MAIKQEKQIDKQHVSITPVDLREMAIKGKSLYQAIAVTARRARQINDEIKTEYQARISTLVPVELDEDEEFEAPNFDQLKISLEIDKLGKPTLEALEEFQNDKLDFRFRDQE
ncbi:MAG: DNA-directed RNA polymerase subunit omega [Bacteroidota bacterium]|nr:DNA-directed RNA polymerase subunit omega [Bacteroidota bacterium]MDP4233005.1 DNA-directed RNA polymerase subunit omega [Bacteroidota bacterium]MDP4242049.1 DNA-directed RNA polymerase subunit omega [Bacteroidota bacterium]MDP4286952.1 DNA-directed RNA polymerase subunit omega [Bacteroidota bacterium]